MYVKKNTRNKISKYNFKILIEFLEEKLIFEIVINSKKFKSSKSYKILLIFLRLKILLFNNLTMKNSKISVTTFKI